ncbi:serine protease [Elioraea sp.]|uniref:S1 family peptidase n=1 Tax=Elioraea sp. TaxID=2185103 RepID=UPI0025C1F512|nr:serine protease [Elioraea sp.]
MRRVPLSAIALAAAIAGCAGPVARVEPTSLQRAGALRTGSGFAVGDSQTIATAWHVVRGCGIIMVADGHRHVAAEVVWRDPQRDLALLRAEAPTRLFAHDAGVADAHASVRAVPPDSLSAPLRGSVLGPSPAWPGLVEVVLDRPLPDGASGAPLLTETGAAVAVLVGRWSMQQNLALASPLPRSEAAPAKVPRTGAAVARISCSRS